MEEENITEKQKFEFEDKLILSEKISEMINPIIKEKREEEYDDSDEITFTTEITKKRNIFNQLIRQKKQSILTMLGQMYNGVIIPNELTVRRGEFFRYRCQYALNLNEVKEKLLKNLHIVTEKITNSKNLDILEYCLEIWDKEKDIEYNKNEYYNRYSSNYEKKCAKKEFKFDEIKLIECSDIDKGVFEILYINCISLYEDGDIEFYKVENKNSNGKPKKVSFQNRNFNALYLKFKDDIDKLGEEFITELDNKIKIRNNELDEIKLKGSHLLMSAELQKGTDDLKGFGE